MEMMKIFIVRRRQFYGHFMAIKVSVFDKEGNLIRKSRVMSGKTAYLELPRKDYVITFSNKAPLMRTVSSSVRIDSTIAERVGIKLELSHIHFMLSFIPFLALLAPMFDHRTLVIYGEKASAIQWERKRGHSVSAMIFLVLSILFFFLACEALTMQLFFPDEGIERWALEGTDEYTIYICEKLADEIVEIMTFPLMVLFAFFFFLVYQRSDRCKYRGRKKTIEEGAPTVLYLRSYKDDAVMAKEVNAFLRPGVSEEESLVSVLDGIAPVIGVGRPDERELPDGAAYITITDPEWQEKIAELAQKAELVVLRLGETQGVLWELKYCLENIDPKKMLLILPVLKDKAGSEDIRAILELHGIDIGNAIQRRRNIRGSIGGFVYFDDDGQPVCRLMKPSLGGAWSVPAEDRIEEALDDILRRFGLPTEKRNNGVWIALFYIFNVLVMALMIFSAYISFKAIEHGRFPYELIEAGQGIEEVGDQIAGLSAKTQADILFYLSMKGLLYQEEESVLAYYRWETSLIDQINSREFELLMDSFDMYPIRYLTLAKKYCSDEEYDRFIAYLVECIELWQEEKDAMMPFIKGSGERWLNIEKDLMDEIQTLPLYQKEDLTQEEELEYERQFRRMLLDLGDQGYDIMPEIWTRYMFLVESIYHAW